MLLEVADKLPPDATLADAIYELEFRPAVEQGPAELDRSERVPVGPVQPEAAQWVKR